MRAQAEAGEVDGEGALEGVVAPRVGCEAVVQDEGVEEAGERAGGDGADGEDGEGVLAVGAEVVGGGGGGGVDVGVREEDDEREEGEVEWD